LTGGIGIGIGVREGGWSRAAPGMVAKPVDAVAEALNKVHEWGFSHLPGSVP
jgi:hypothetical protein